MELWLLFCTICCLACAMNYVRTWPCDSKGFFIHARLRFNFGGTCVSRGPRNKARYLECVTWARKELKSIIEVNNDGVSQSKSLRINKKQCQRLSEELTKLLANPERPAEQDCILNEFYCTVRKALELVQDCCDEKWLLKAVELGNSQEHFLEILLDLHRLPDVVELVHGFKGDALDMMGSEFQPTNICDKVKNGMLAAWKSDKTDLMSMVENEIRHDDPERYLAHQLEDEPSLVAPPEIEKQVTQFDFLRTPYLYRSGDIIVFRVILFSNKKFVMKMRCSKTEAKELENGPEELQNEADMMKKCSHPYAVGLLGYWEVTRIVGPKVPLLLMESMECSLKELIDERFKKVHWWGGTRGFPGLNAINLLLPVAKVMRHLHRIGVVHRDLKPQNILYTHVPEKQIYLPDDISVKLADFGDALKVEDPVAGTWPRAGTNGYMDPAVWRIEPGARANVDLFKADVFSFGMVFGEVLAGSSPLDTFHCSTSIEIQRKLDCGERPPLPNNTPEFLKSLVESCWALNPDDRPLFKDICWKLQNAELVLVNGF